MGHCRELSGPRETRAICLVKNVKKRAVPKISGTIPSPDGVKVASSSPNYAGWMWSVPRPIIVRVGIEMIIIFACNRHV